eukprot:GHVR01150384.1.p1 GENE.GHVR01150384.1~~GHVR01150384.1.p1  ORF type:complete len:146 (+),score=21.96 GHVR01150384.1:180-617(+)
MFSGVVYFDLRPCLTNLRYHPTQAAAVSSSSDPPPFSSPFCLLDLDSFYPPTPGAASPYPSTEVDFIYGLWQAVVAVWAVCTGGGTEHELEKKCKLGIFPVDDSGIASSIYKLGCGKEIKDLSDVHRKTIAGCYGQGASVACLFI